MIDNSIDYGPLTQLIGSWYGDKGVDISPEPDGSERSPYFETLCFTPVGDSANAEEQCLAVLHYRQIIQRQSNGEVFHDQTGYWMWDEKNNTVMQSLVIPRGVCVLAASDKLHHHAKTLSVAADINDKAFTIVQSPFLQAKAKTTAYSHTLTVDGDLLHYSQTIMLNIYGRQFEHKDENQLIRE